MERVTSSDQGCIPNSQSIFTGPQSTAQFERPVAWSVEGLPRTCTLQSVRSPRETSLPPTSPPPTTTVSPFLPLTEKQFLSSKEAAVTEALVASTSSFYGI